MRWKIRKVNGQWRIWDSFGEWDSDYPDWASAVDWAGSPFKRDDYYARAEAEASDE